MANTPVRVVLPPGGTPPPGGTGVVDRPTGRLCTYHILNGADGSYKGALRGVTNEPKFTETLNAGCSTLELLLDHFPSEVSFTDIVRVDYPTGVPAGFWKHEKMAVSDSEKMSYQLILTPVSAELGDVDVNANYSSDPTQPTPPLGATGFDVAPNAYIPTCKHLYVGNINSNGAAYSYVFNSARVKDTLDQAVRFGGPGWWWRCSSVGDVDLTNVSQYTHSVTRGREVTLSEWDGDILSLCNSQTVIGAQPADALTPLTATAVDLNPLSPYSIPNAGKRVAPVYNDSSLLDQASCNAMAVNMLAYAERVTTQRKLTILANPNRKFRPGDAITIRQSFPDPTKLGPDSVLGPYLIIEVTEYGATNKFDITVNSDFVCNVALSPTMAVDAYLRSAQANPTSTALSPDGSTGTVGSGVLGGSGGGGSQFTAVPSAPTGLFITSGIDLVAQTNNAYAIVSWSPSAVNDVVTGFDVRWRKAGDSQYYTVHVGVDSVKIGNLTPGIAYSFSIRSQNDLGKWSDWSPEVSAQIALDAVAPAAPTGLAAFRTPRGANVTWDGNSEADLAGYLLQASVSGGPFQAVNSAPDLKTSSHFFAPSGTLPGAALVFQVAAVDWSGNQSPWSTATAEQTDGTNFDEIMTGDVTATGTITTGMLRTGVKGARVEMDNAGVRLFDPTGNDHGSGVPGMTARLNSVDGSAFFSGVVSASSIHSNSPSGQPGMSINMDGTPPTMFIYDNTRTRVQVGGLPSGGYGMQIFNAGGQAVWDSDGLIQVMSLLNSASNATTSSFAPPLSNVSNGGTIPGSSIGFNLGRPLTVYVVGTVVGYVSSSLSLGENPMIVMVTAGNNSPASAVPTYGNNINSFTVGGTGTAICTQVLALPAGSFTASLQLQNSTGTLSVWGYSIDVFLMGS